MVALRLRIGGGVRGPEEGVRGVELAHAQRDPILPRNSDSKKRAAPAEI